MKERIAGNANKSFQNVTVVITLSKKRDNNKYVSIRLADECICKFSDGDGMRLDTD
ncbi:MAG: hypothetical protein LBR10_10015 [Prevotellaceae bacterium]|nr:hypothetical protein [Prevotellaceae bacterium]